MAYQDWFSNWQRGEVALRGYFRPPEELELDAVVNMDRNAAHMQRQAEALLANLAEYRQALAERYAALSVMPYKTHLELERRPDYYTHKVIYYVRLVREYEDGTTVKELSETYSGKERREALARFEALKKERPGIEVVKDIARRGWEK